MKPPMTDAMKVLFGIWILLGIGGALFFYGSENAALKRKLYPLFLLLITAVFLGFTFFLQGSLPLFLTVAVVVIGFMNLRMTRFCDACGRMVVSRAFFVAPKFCQGCGAKLTDAD